MNGSSNPTLATQRAFAVVIASLLFALIATPASAHDIVKTFEFGPGMTGAKSHMRTFAIPSGVNIIVAVNFRRFGPTSSSNDVSVTFDVHSPGPETEGPLRATKTEMATVKGKDIVVYNGVGDADGCEREWHIRARHTSGTVPVSAVSGTITVTYSSTAKNVSFDPSNIELPIKIGKGTTVSKKLYIPAGSGLLRIRAEWHTDPLDVLHFGTFDKLTLKLLRGGSVVETSAAYSNHAPDDKTPRRGFNFYISPLLPSSDWKLEISGADVDIVDFRINRSGSVESSLTPGCQ